MQRERRFTLLEMDEFERQKKMQYRMMPKHTPGITVMVILLTIQAILGLFFSLPLLAGLLAPGRPVIVSGAAIFAGPAGGISLVIALASPIIAWGVWQVKSWARQRVVLLELFSLAIGVFELFEPGVNRIVSLSYIILAALLLICLYASPNGSTPCFSCESRIRFTRGKQPGMLVSTAEKEQRRQDVTRGF